MDKKEFKTIFTKYGKQHGFERAYGGWFKESDECIIVLDLQKSNYGDYYQLLIKVFIQNIFGVQYKKSKDLVKRDNGNVLSGEPEEYRKALNFENSIGDEERGRMIEELFKNHIVPFSNNALAKNGIIDMVSRNELWLLPAVSEALGL